MITGIGISACIFTISCRSKDNTDEIRSSLNGRWYLDSATDVRGNFYKTTIIEEIEFLNKGDYKRKWRDYDVENSGTGKYGVLINPKRSLATVTLIGDVMISSGDTILPHYINFDIKNIEGDRMLTFNDSEFIKRKNAPFIIFNKQKIYKRRK